ncbi:MAG: 2-succinyl-5-enolpyruvyl-6-hydroxy-3-cyclohexene-1-carboxylic-acid synthase [Chloroflexi bacterium]|nr:2-succinyl-5-enolpyruvyl-6-hydroxy-3-cyclohexene-1-carboxylic-acid synthase [Chloroflexota bacterium]MCY4248074.1 2-succinyl-5-enolpyruvyl-6-hydroxy-3-cyclohexene-1-carboxylic-acid synthase [Chloroflexota bacterium]
MPNPATSYATTFIDALVAAGLRHVCIAPGSRHTPLVLALARHRERIQLTSHLDERCAAFFALGWALGADEPAAVVCTSGSAAANVLPAIVEAHQSRRPLIILTADRPPELRHSGANQTIDQIKLYGDYVDLFVDAPLPEVDPPSRALENLRTLAARAYATAAANRGVVHINMPFRKPFEPAADDTLAIDRRPTTRFFPVAPSGEARLRPLLTPDLLDCRGIIYCGHGSAHSEAEQNALRPWLSRLSHATGFPVLAEFSSNLRGDGVLGAYESWLADVDMSGLDALIRLGAPPLCAPMQALLAKSQLRYHIYCSRAGEWADDSHSITHHLAIDPAGIDAREFDNLPAADDSWRARLAKLDASAWRLLGNEMTTGDFFDGAVAYDMARLMPANGALFIGSSLPVRQLDQFAPPRAKPVQAFANRGASGIDGNGSTALGIALARKGRPTAALLGDITLYHDMNGLLAVRRCDIPITIVLLNNDGGGIFQRLPVRQFEPAFRDYFLTPHGLDFAQVAKLYGLRHIRADNRATFCRAFTESIAGSKASLIEVRTNALSDLQRREAIMRAIKSSRQAPVGRPSGLTP